VTWVEQPLGWSVDVVKVPQRPRGDTGLALRELVEHFSDELIRGKKEEKEREIGTMRGYSRDLRERVIRQYGLGKSLEELVAVFSISKGTIRRWNRQYQQNGQVEAKRREHWQRKIGAEQEDLLRAQVERRADATLAQHVAEWEKRVGVKVSLATMWRSLKRIGWSLKKRQWEPWNATRGNANSFGN
jgi:transposase